MPRMWHNPNTMTEETATPSETPTPDAADAPAITRPDCKGVHKLTVPLQVDSEEGAWIHWCSDCGGMSSETSDVENPKGPWFLPGELSEMDVERINRAARGEG